MKTYRVPISWTMWGTVDVQATDKTAAVAKVVAEAILPDEPELLDPGLIVSEHLVAEIDENGEVV